MSMEDFIEKLLEKLDEITSLSFIAKSQAKYLKKCKEEPKDNEIIILYDFVENYKYVIQVETQSYHWS